MLEDILTQDQRIRLEALALANAVRGHTESAELVLELAKAYENYVRGTKN